MRAIASLTVGDAEGGAKRRQRWIATGILTGKAEQTDVAELGARADPAMFQNPIRRERSLKYFVGVKRRSDVHRENQFPRSRF